MKNNRLLIALVVLIGVGALAVSASRSHQSATTLDTPGAALPKLKKEDVTSVEVRKPGQEAITLAKQADGWQLTQPVVAKADTSAVDAMLEKLTALDVTGVAATRKENHTKLQVDKDTGIQVKVKTGDKVALDLFVGMTKGGSTMLRLDGQDTVFTAGSGLRYAFDKEVKQFRDRVITDIDTADVVGMLVHSEKGDFKFEKDDKNWAQAAGEKPIKEFSDAKVQSLASTLSRLRAADFAAPTMTAETAGFTPDGTKVVFSLKAAPPVTLEVGKEHENDREYYARVTGKDTIFRISKFTVDRMMADASAFTEDKKEAKAEGEEAAPNMMPGGEGAQGQLPPEIMEQLKRQLATQGGHP